MADQDYSVQITRARARQAAAIERGKSPEADKQALPRGTMNLSARAAQVLALAESLSPALAQSPTPGLRQSSE